MCSSPSSFIVPRTRPKDKALASRELHRADTALDHLDEAGCSVRYEEVFTKMKPEMVIAFTGGNDTKQVIDRANESGITVIEPCRDEVDS